MSGVQSIESGASPGDRMNTVTELKTAQRSTAPVPIAEAWPRLTKAYSDLGIPLTTVNPTDHIVGNEGMRRTHTMANDRISAFLDCGTGGGGANADMYAINMSVVSRLAPLADGTTEVATLLQATATPMSFGTPPIVCATTGALEARIAAAVADTAHTK